jgi:hypothetical protein
MGLGSNNVGIGTILQKNIQCMITPDPMIQRLRVQGSQSQLQGCLALIVQSLDISSSV